jgi:hypothetical protein
MSKNNFNFIKKYLDYVNDKDKNIQKNIQRHTFIDDYIYLYLANNEIKAKYEILGSLVNISENKYFNWAWDQKLINNSISKYLLEYGLSLNDSNNIEEHIFLKSILVNPKIEIKNSLNIDMYINCYRYLLKDLIQFIFPIKYYINENDKTKYIIYYYLILN